MAHAQIAPTELHAILASCSALTTVRQMRSFIGAFKVLSRVLPGCSALISPLDDALDGHQSQEFLTWSNK